VIARVSLRILRKLFHRLEIEMSEEVEAALLPAGAALVVAMGCMIGIVMIDPPPTLRDVSLKLGGTIAVLALHSATSALVKPLEDTTKYAMARRADLEVVWIARAVRIFASIIAIAMILRVWGIDISNLIGGLGVFGAAIAFLLQDYLRNVIAGLANSRENRFTVGDWVRVDGVADGTVVRTGLRSTTIRGFDLSLSQVPNQELANRPLTNFTRRPHRRIHWEIDVTYDTTAAQLRQICEEIDSYLRTSKDFIETPLTPRFVRVKAFGPYSIKILVYCFTTTNVWGEFLEVQQELAMTIKAIVEGVGASFAFPSRSIYIERTGTVPEAMVERPGPSAGRAG
jgi:MscS family membrane protein